MELTKIDSSKFQKNTTIEFLRYFFMIILLIWHGGWDYLEHGYLVVEFYFILSGYFLLTVILESQNQPHSILLTN